MRFYKIPGYEDFIIDLEKITHINRLRIDKAEVYMVSGLVIGIEGVGNINSLINKLLSLQETMDRERKRG